MQLRILLIPFFVQVNAEPATATRRYPRLDRHEEPRKDVQSLVDSTCSSYDSCSSSAMARWQKRNCSCVCTIPRRCCLRLATRWGMSTACAAAAGPASAGSARSRRSTMSMQQNVPALGRGTRNNQCTHRVAEQISLFSPLTVWRVTVERGSSIVLPPCLKILDVTHVKSSTSP